MTQIPKEEPETQEPPINYRLDERTQAHKQFFQPVGINMDTHNQMLAEWQAKQKALLLENPTEKLEP